MKAAPGPYDTLEVGAHTTMFHAYIVDAKGRKIGVAWGPHAEKVWTSALFAASFDMLEALQAALPHLDNAGSPGGCDGTQDDCSHCAAIRLARAAISKALGAIN